MLEACLELHRRLGNDVEVAATLSTLSLARLKAGEAVGAAASEREALAMFRALGETEGEAIGLLHLGQIAVYLGDTAAAQVDLRESLRIAKTIGHHEVEGEADLRLAECAFDCGRVDDARRHLERSLEVCAEAGDRRGEARAIHWLGKLDLESGDLGAARQRLGAAGQIFLDFEMREELVDCLEDEAELIGQGGNIELAVRLSAAAQGYRERLELVRAPKAVQRWESRLASMRERLPPKMFDAAWASGLAMDFHAALHGARTVLEQTVPA
jgi:tetratricopeptide (TPR) repeat protein